MISKDFLLECQQYIRGGGILSGAVFTPVPIDDYQSLIDIDKKEVQAYMEANRSLVFAQLLFHMIDKTGKKDSEIYKKAQMDRRLFSRIRSSRDYIPAKKTVLSLCLALELSKGDADKLLSTAGYSLSNADDFDLVVSFCIEKKVYDLTSVNEVLYHFGYEPF